ncbi:DJ-1/PfpI family protein [Bradyrhizobium ontarionense]|uniref:DJ-1/PfpI family protein n=1 Tax=Bradyrhizobium ontarionense TaxID=2898149 RepID=A0ABY3R7G0_9BRAD|nr:DJ-1/PfpI family protein [Bradyrhizobium sp. A19]UFZ02756.1 DJ-1/PfpI family protein [Bradyrhizobium sp. A19]
MTATPLEIGLLFFPGMTQLDVTGPFEVLARLPGARIHLLWKRIEPITSDVGLTLLPTTAFADCPQLDVLCVGGGPGQMALMDDLEVMTFVAKAGATARYVTSVCAGCFILAGAGLLDGYRSACHWLSRDQLAILGAIPVEDRIVVDRNRISGGGVTAGIDFAFQVAAELCGSEVAKRLQLMLEYDPKPPFDINERNAPPEMIAEIRASARSMLDERRRSNERAMARLRAGHVDSRTA